MFIIAIIFGHAPILKATAYFLGAGGYLAELLFPTDLFRVRLHPEELFMVYCFGPLYILMGLSYVFVS